jgi:hypothetical protein
MHDDATPLIDCDSSEPALIFPYRGGPRDSEHKRSLQRKSHAFGLAGPILPLRSRRAIARIVVVIAPIVCEMATSTAFQLSARGQPATRSETLDPFAEFIAEASTRFAVRGKLDPCRDAGRERKRPTCDVVARCTRPDATHAWYLG